jgi:hypothetical protein
MAYQRADPSPFIPEGLQYLDIPNRRVMVRAVAPFRPPARNEDLAIVSFNPLPNNEMQFAAVRAILRDFLRHERLTAFLDIQPTHLGQALVQFVHAYDRDELIAQSPIVFGDVSVSFYKHNQGRNWRLAQFNHECWLLVLGLPNDYWTERHIHGAIGEFARVLHFEADPRKKCRLLIRARVTHLEMIPQFIVYSDPDSVNGDSWTLQCEILQQVQQNLQQAPPEEEIPNELNMEPIIPFDFFGLGQPIDGNNGLLDLNQNVADLDVQDNQPNNVQDDAQQHNLAWDPWAPWPEAQQQHPLAQEQGLNLNVVPGGDQQLNLNLPAIQDPNQDLLPVILNPVAPGGFDPQLGMDLVFNMHEEHLPQLQDEVFFMNPLEEELDQIVNQDANINVGLQLVVHAQQEEAPPSPINLLDEEIPLDQLLNLDGEDMEGQNEVYLGDQAQMERAENVQIQGPAQEVQSPAQEIQSPAQGIQSPAQELQSPV